MNFDVKSLILMITTAVGGAVYVESTYMKVAAAEQQFRLLRLDRLYRDKDDCDRILWQLHRGEGEKESELCKRVRREIESLEKQEKK